MPDTSFDYVNIFAGSYESDGKKIEYIIGLHRQSRQSAQLDLMATNGRGCARYGT